MRHRLVHRGLVLAMCASAGAVAHAQSSAEGVARVMTNQLGPLTRATPRGKMEPVTVYFREGALRIDFHDAGGKPYRLLLPADGQAGWIVDARGAALPALKARWPLVFDPQAPCGGQGMFANCQSQGPGSIAARNARHWRYRFTRNTGPGLTSRGDMWLDAETGLVLFYRGETGAGLPQEWRVQSVDYGTLPEGTFDLPKGITQDR